MRDTPQNKSSTARDSPFGPQLEGGAKSSQANSPASHVALPGSWAMGHGGKEIFHLGKL